ncbi:MAG: S41 family peptidase [Eggerthellaceae bacterium]|jgi:carboxyl-terminal processing protease
MRKSRREVAAKENRSARLVRALCLFVVLCLAFALGFLLRGNDVVMDRLGLSDLTADSTVNPGATISGNVSDSASARVAEVQGILDEYSLDEYDLDSASTTMVKDLLKSTGDNYVRYYSPKKYAEYRKNNDSDTSGIGALFGDYNGQAYVVDLLEGGSAEAAGVQIGDFIVSINGERHDQGWTVEEAIKAIEGQEGKSVVIVWRRPTSIDAEGGTEYTTTLSCKKVEQKNVTTSYSKARKVGYIRIRQLGEDTDTYVKKAVRSLSKKGAKAYILDLRNVAGGYLTQAVNVVSLFQKSGTVVRIETKDSESTRSVSGKTVTDAPLVVLVNRNTSAAAEVVASSLQNSNRAEIVGTTTMGHGTVQVMRELSYGGAITYTAARYLTSDGHSFDGVGIVPDIRAEATGGKTDTQLRVALDEASAQISG